MRGIKWSFSRTCRSERRCSLLEISKCEQVSSSLQAHPGHAVAFTRLFEMAGAVDVEDDAFEDDPDADEGVALKLASLDTDDCGGHWVMMLINCSR